MSAGTTVKWYVYDKDDCRVSMVPHWIDDPVDAAEHLAGPWWHRSDDYVSEFEITVLEPVAWVGKYSITVESEPVFRASRLSS